MSLSELLTECKNTRRNKPIRVFAGCMTLFNGNPAVISKRDWVKLHPYFNCEVVNKGVVNNTFVITI